MPFGGKRYADQLATGTGLAQGKLDTAADAAGCNQPVIASTAIHLHLQDAAKALQYLFGTETTSAERVGAGNTGWCGAILRSIVSGQGAEVSSLGFSGTGPSFVDEQLGRPFQVS